MNPSRKQIITWVGIALLLLLAWFLRGVLAYFLVALIISFIGSPLMRYLNTRVYFGKYKLPRGVSAFIVIVSFALVISAFLYIVLPPLVEQISSLSSISEMDLEKSFGEPIGDVKQWFISIGVSTEDFTIERMGDSLKSFMNLDNITTFASDVVKGTTSFIGWIFIVVFISFFLLKEQYMFYRALHLLTPTKYGPKMQRIVRNLNRMLGRYFIGLIMQIFVFGTYIYVGLSICGEKYALTVAIFSGLVNLISYIGPLIGVSFALLFSVFSNIGASFYGIIVPEMSQVLLVYAIAIMLDNFITYPLIFSSSLKVHPLELFFVILSGAQLGGLGGMMIAAPLYTVIRIFAKETLSQFDLIKSLTRKI